MARHSPRRDGAEHRLYGHDLFLNREQSGPIFHRGITKPRTNIYARFFFGFVSTNAFNVATLRKSSWGSSMGVSAMNAACSVRGSFNNRRNGSIPMVPL